MSLMDLTVEQVRKEITDIVVRYPDRTGGEFNNGVKGCVYFKDATGSNISVSEHYGEKIDFSPERLVEPVCIIGQWVHDFHPELKEDYDFNMVLFRNSILGNSVEAAQSFDDDVFDLLADIQCQQDEISMTWSGLVF